MTPVFISHVDDIDFSARRKNLPPGAQARSDVSS